MDQTSLQLKTWTWRTGGHKRHSACGHAMFPSLGGEGQTRPHTSRKPAECRGRSRCESHAATACSLPYLPQAQHRRSPCEEKRSRLNFNFSGLSGKRPKRGAWHCIDVSPQKASNATMRPGKMQSTGGPNARVSDKCKGGRADAKTRPAEPWSEGIVSHQGLQRPWQWIITHLEVSSLRHRPPK
jgi:hypothetical protein